MDGFARTECRHSVWYDLATTLAHRVLELPWMGSSARRRQHRRTVAAIVILLLATIGVDAQTRSGRADLEGIWTNGTITPLQRPPEFTDRITLTAEEARIYEAGFFDRMLNNIASDDDRLLQNDFNDIYQETQTLDRLRTALIVDPPDGRLPAFLPSARPAARRSLDDPESLTLAERCLVANMVGVPHVPNPLGPTYFQFVQTEGWLLIYGESFRLTRVIRIGGTHLPPRVQELARRLNWQLGGQHPGRGYDELPRRHPLSAHRRTPASDRAIYPLGRADAGVSIYR